MPSAHLLLIEDDPDIAAVMGEELRMAGYRVSGASSVMTGLLQAREAFPDLIITDLGLPDGDGSEVVSRLRRSSWLPIIVLTARDDVAQKVALLELGANDYLVKPVDPRELLIRIAVQLREQGGDVLVVGELTLDRSRHLARLGGEDLHVSPRELDLLALLMQQPGRVYSRAEIVRIVWNDELAADSNTIDVHVSNLRQKLRQHDGHHLIRNVRGLGYALKVTPTDPVSTGQTPSAGVDAMNR